MYSVLQDRTVPRSLVVSRSWLRERRTSPPWVFVSVGVLYALLATASFEIFGAMSIGVTFFPPAGLTFAAFLLGPRRIWPAIAAAIVVAEVGVDLWQGMDVWPSLGWASANLVEPVVGALVAGALGPAVAFTRRFAVAFVAGGLVAGPLIGAAIGASVLAAGDGPSWWSSYPDAWVGDALGVLVVAPVVITLTRGDRFIEDRHIDGMVLATMALAAAAIYALAGDLPTGYLVIPLLAVPAVRSSPRELAVTAAVIASALTAATADGRGPWSPGDSTEHADLVAQQAFLLFALGGAWLLKLEVAERLRAVEEAHRAEAQLATARQGEHDRRLLEIMNDALGDLAGAATTAEIAGAVARHSSRLFGSISTSIVIADDQGDLEIVAEDGWTPATGDDRRYLTATDHRAVAAHQRQPVFRDRGPTDPPSGAGADDRPGGAVAGVPLQLKDGRAAALGLQHASSPRWEAATKLRALAFASILADAVNRSRQSEEDRHVALTLQAALMPEIVGPSIGTRAAARYLPASTSLEVGGDWCDVIETSSSTSGSVTVVVGDVVGHNLEAAAVMGKLAAASRALAHAERSPSGIVNGLDRLARTDEDATMTTVVCAAWDARSGILRYCNAGHPPPMLRAPDGTVVDLSDNGLPLAVGPDQGYGDCTVRPPAGSTVLFYTDGLVESRTEPLDERLARLRSAFTRCAPGGPDATCDRIVATMLPGEVHEDDVAVVCLELALQPFTDAHASRDRGERSTASAVSSD
jgi:serine phosphatase RsbU (regulator of sigma subunit)/integral membrane sensor domain MASE1